VKDLGLFSAAIAAFRKEHPAEMGWTIHFFLPYDSTGTRLDALPAFLRAKLPPGGFDETIGTRLYWSTGAGFSRKRLTDLPMRRRGRGLGEASWAGDIRFSWQGSPVHIRRIFVNTSNLPFSSLKLIAAKSWPALDNLWKELARFSRVPFPILNKIIVVNGPDIRRTRAEWDGVFLPTGLKAQVRGSVESFLSGRDKYRQIGLPYRRGLLFVGPPGNGKTLVARTISWTYKVAMVALNIKAGLDEREIDRAFSLSEKHPPCLLLLEDLDKIVACPGVSLSYLLNKLDGLESSEGTLILATSNEPEKLDPALLHRPSRFDRVWEFPLPGLAERLAMLELRGSRWFSPAARRAAAEAGSGFSMAGIQELVVSACMLAAHEKEAPADKHLEESVRQMRVQVRVCGGLHKAVAGCSPVGFLAGREDHAG
jgi:hypothetical protein